MISCKNVWTIASRDFYSYFTSPIAYIVIAGFLFITNWMSFNTLAYFIQASSHFSMTGSQKVTIIDGVIRPIFGGMNIVLIFLIPFITMRLFAEEKKLHTIELLMTAPLTLMQITLGKFLAALLFVSVMLLSSLIFPIILMVQTQVEPGVVFSNFLGTLLMGACYLGMGILFSAMSENQIVAGALTFAACFFSWIINWVQQFTGSVIAEFLLYLSLIHHYNSLSQGLLIFSDIFYYFSFIGFFLFLTHQVLDSYRWR